LADTSVNAYCVATTKMQKVKVQGHTRSNRDSMAEASLHPVWSNSFFSFLFLTRRPNHFFT